MATKKSLENQTDNNHYIPEMSTKNFNFFKDTKDNQPKPCAIIRNRPPEKKLYDHPSSRPHRVQFARRSMSHYPSYFQSQRTSHDQPGHHRPWKHAWRHRFLHSG